MSKYDLNTLEGRMNTAEYFFELAEILNTPNEVFEAKYKRINEERREKIRQRRLENARNNGQTGK